MHVAVTLCFCVIVSVSVHNSVMSCLCVMYMSCLSCHVPPPVSFRLSPLHCTVLAFVLRVAWSPPHGRWLIRLYNDERTLHLDLRYFHATGYAPWWRDHLFIGRQDDLCTLAACGLHVGIFVSCHVSILPLASSSTKNATGNRKK